MNPHYTDDSVTLWHGDALEVMRAMPADSVDAVCTDPPYSLGFMGRAWDTHDTPAAFAEWCRAWAVEAYRVLKPGGHLLAFGGTRTWHRLTCGIEDAGFEIRDTITWLYGSGFPKSLDVSKAIPATDGARRWQGWGTALKPASEPCVVARKPLAGTVAQTVLAYGTGALNIDATRVGTPEDKRAAGTKTYAPGRLAGETNGLGVRQPAPHDGLGRWPSNVVLSHAATPDGTDGCAERCAPGCPVAELDRQSGTLTSGGRLWSAGDRDTASWRALEGRTDVPTRGDYRREGDSGGASRFFPTFRYEAKAPTSERPRIGGKGAAMAANRCANCGRQDLSGNRCQCPEPKWIPRNGDEVVAHPTVKPLDLMRWLVRLVTPPGGLVLDPFAGSGTTAEACVLEGFRCHLVELEASHLPLIVKRLAKPLQLGLFAHDE